MVTNYFILFPFNFILKKRRGGSTFHFIVILLEFVHFTVPRNYLATVSSLLCISTEVKTQMSFGQDTVTNVASLVSILLPLICRSLSKKIVAHPTNTTFSLSKPVICYSLSTVDLVMVIDC